MRNEIVTSKAEVLMVQRALNEARNLCRNRVRDAVWDAQEALQDAQAWLGGLRDDLESADPGDGEELAELRTARAELRAELVRHADELGEAIEEVEADLSALEYGADKAADAIEEAIQQADDLEQLLDRGDGDSDEEAEEDDLDAESDD
jgi:hypothetical protein